MFGLWINWSSAFQISESERKIGAPKSIGMCFFLLLLIVVVVEKGLNYHPICFCVRPQRIYIPLLADTLFNFFLSITHTHTLSLYHSLSVICSLDCSLSMCILNGSPLNSHLKMDRSIYFLYTRLISKVTHFEQIIKQYEWNWIKLNQNARKDTKIKSNKSIQHTEHTVYNQFTPK